MNNIIKMDWHRFISNKIMYFLLFVYAFFQVFGIFMMVQFGQEMAEGGVHFQSMGEGEFIQFVLAQPPSWVMLYILVFTVYFYMSEYNSGFYKNYMTIKRARTYSVYSKILIQGLFTLFLFIVMILSDWIGRTIFFEQSAFGSWAYFAKVVGGQFLLHWAFSIVMLCVVMLARNMIASLIVGLILALNVPGLVVGALENLTDLFEVSPYWLVTTIMSPLDYNQVEHVVHVACVSLISIALFTFIALKYKRNEDLT